MNQLVFGTSNLAVSSLSYNRLIGRDDLISEPVVGDARCGYLQHIPTCQERDQSSELELFPLHPAKSLSSSLIYTNIELMSTTIWDEMLGEWETGPDNGPSNDVGPPHVDWLGTGGSPFINHASDNLENQMFAQAPYLQHTHTHAEVQPPMLTFADLPPYLMGPSQTGATNESLEFSQPTQAKSNRSKQSTQSASDVSLILHISRYLLRDAASKSPS